MFKNKYILFLILFFASSFSSISAMQNNKSVFDQNLDFGQYFNQISKDNFLEIINYFYHDLFKYNFSDSRREFNDKLKKILNLRLINKSFKQVVDKNIKIKQLNEFFEEHLLRLINIKCLEAAGSFGPYINEYKTCIAADCGSRKYFENFFKKAKESPKNFNGYSLTNTFTTKIFNNYDAPLKIAINKYPKLAKFIIESFNSDTIHKMHKYGRLNEITDMISNQSNKELKKALLIKKYQANLIRAIIFVGYSLYPVIVKKYGNSAFFLLVAFTYPAIIMNTYSYHYLGGAIPRPADWFQVVAVVYLYMASLYFFNI